MIAPVAARVAARHAPHALVEGRVGWVLRVVGPVGGNERPLHCEALGNFESHPALGFDIIRRVLGLLKLRRV